MAKKKRNKKNEQIADELMDTADNQKDTTLTDAEKSNDSGEAMTGDITKEEKLEQEVAALNDKYLRLYSEFENFRRRTARERIDLFKNASQDVLGSLLPILDDFERAIRSMEESKDEAALKDGIKLVYHKMVNTLEQQGLSAFESIGAEFDSDLHEAVTKIPAPSKDMKGKVVDEIEKGYKLNDKVLRYAKVVVGE